MELLINSPNLADHEDLIREEVTRSLQRFADRLTRVEIFVKDLNGARGGNDQRCVIEARPRGLDPVAVEHDAATPKEAAAGAAKKLHRHLDHKLGKLDGRHPH